MLKYWASRAARQAEEGRCLELPHSRDEASGLAGRRRAILGLYILLFLILNNRSLEVDFVFFSVKSNELLALVVLVVLSFVAGFVIGRRGCRRRRRPRRNRPASSRAATDDPPSRLPAAATRADVGAPPRAHLPGGASGRPDPGRGPVDRISWEEAQRLEYRPLAPGERFGPRWATWWFRLETAVDDERARFLWEAGGEAALWRDGRPLHGLDGQHHDAPLPGPRFEVELACYEDVAIERCEVGLLDLEAWRLYWDFETLRALKAEADSGLDPAWAGELGTELNRFCNELDPAILERLYERRNASAAHRVAAVGHAHLDTAWLWPLAESKRKAVRTWSTQLRLLDEYPGYRFAFSSAQHYDWIERGLPELWTRVRAAVADGGFVPTGGTWVEPDCNIPSGESSSASFCTASAGSSRGSASAAPSSGARICSATTRSSPRSCAAPASRVSSRRSSSGTASHGRSSTRSPGRGRTAAKCSSTPPTETYTSEATVGQLRRAVHDYRDHDHSRTSLLVFGYGDGGGGPTAAMLETLGRTRDLQGLPCTEPHSPAEFFEALEAEPGPSHGARRALPRVSPRHLHVSGPRQRANRRCEQALHDAEFLATVSDSYPREELDRLWKLLLLNQFHDILPGSSIASVYEDTHRELAEVESGAEAIAAAAHPGGVVNTVGVARAEVAADPDGELHFVEAPPYGSGAIAEPSAGVRIDGLTLQNRHLRAEFRRRFAAQPDRAGDRPWGVRRTWKPARAVRGPPGCLGRVVDPAHLETREDCPPASSWSVVTASPLRAEIAFERELGESSRLRQVVRLDAGSRRLEFRTEVDWHESHRLLKVCSRSR